MKFPQGFSITGIRTGLKEKGRDLGIIYSNQGLTATALFTRNLFPAWSVIFSKKNINNRIKILLTNSGQANAGTGKKGEKFVKNLCSVIKKEFNIPKKSILYASTGVIGEIPDLKKIKRGVLYLKNLKEKSIIEPENFSESILTTDTRKKCAYYNGKTFKIFATCKGSGMIEPKMATFLCFILTDFSEKRTFFRKILKEITDKTFNSISIDGETSTNDSIFLLSSCRKKGSIKEFKEALFCILDKLKFEILKDGEGVTKIIEIEIKGKKEKELEKLARHIATSPLIKTAINGSDPNWGRILSRIGSSDVNINTKKLKIKIGNTTVFRDNSPLKFNEAKLKNYMKKEKIKISIETGSRLKKINFFTTDLSEKYVRINAKYRT